MNINQRIIATTEPPYIIAELSANHNGSMLKAKETILAASQSGVHAIKLQTYTPETMTINCDSNDFVINGGLWDGYKLYDLYRKAHTPYEWHQELFEYSKKLGITMFSTPFDETAVDLLEGLDAPAYKIASFEITDIPLIKYVARTKKPLLISTGMSSEDEIAAALSAARNAGCEELLLFHCISSYPTPIHTANLKKILNLRAKFGVEVGLSDHTLGTTAAIASIPLGATAIEKHFIIDRNDGGPDSSFSINAEEMRELVTKTHDAWLALGSDSFDRPEIETASLAYRRSLYFVRDLPAGHTITNDDVKRIRPGYGLNIKHIESVLGSKTTKPIKRGQRVTWDSLYLVNSNE